MHRDQTRSVFKHLDFMVLDVLCMQLCFCISYWVYVSFSNPYRLPTYQLQAVILIVSQLLVMAFANNYKGILRRSWIEEALAVTRYVAAIFIVALVYLFAVHQSALASRMQFGLTAAFLLVGSFSIRQVNKWRIRTSDQDQKKSLIIITTSDLALGTVQKLTNSGGYLDYFISGVLLLDRDPNEELLELNMPVMRLSSKAMSRMSHGWVDEVFIMQPENYPLPRRLMDDLYEMGMVVNYSSSAMSEERWPVTDVRKLGDFRVLTSGIDSASAGQVFVKRAMDIVGGSIGSVITLLLFIVFMPIIKAKSPGPVFFKQQRVGKNGKTFTMYKFRSMIVDAEERKAELVSMNNVDDGMMFKMKNDPRVIGSEKAARKGRPCGFGHFIRRTSLDEFPQFFNVLKGDMSMVGTRPPTLDEWEKYDFGHRARMSMRPGITGLWQVSGRSKITDFHEVVRLDREYIEHWNLSLDLKILAKTLIVVIRGRGAL